MDPKTRDPENGKRLWELSEALLDELGIKFKKKAN